MIYDYYEEIVNRSNEFFDEKNFVGYILPNGSIYACKDHNVSNIDTFLKMYLMILIDDYNKKDELLNDNTTDKLAQVVLNKLKRMSQDEMKAFLEFSTNNNLLISDLLVNFFGCHLVTRLKKEIITSEINHMCFYNYLLHDFKIKTIPRMMYDDNKKEYYYIEAIDRNDYLYDEIKRIKDDIKDDEINLFYKSR